MSVHVSARVWDQCQQTGEALLVMLALADHSNDDGECWPSFDRIAEMARVEKRSAIRILKRLEDAGEIEVERGGGRGHTNRYLLLKYARQGMTNSDRETPIPQETVTGESPLPAGNSVPESPIVDAETVTLEPQTVTAVQERVTLVHERVTGGSPEPLEPLRNHQGEPSEENSLRDDQRMVSSLCGVYGTTPESVTSGARERFELAVTDWRRDGVTADHLDTAIGIYREGFRGRLGERPSRAELDDAIGQARAGKVSVAAAVDQVISDSMDAAAERLTASPPTSEGTTLWRVVRKDVSRQMTPQTFKAWIEPLEVVGFDGETLTLRAPVDHVHAFVTKRLLATVEGAVAAERPGVSVVVLMPEAAVVVGSVVA